MDGTKDILLETAIIDAFNERTQIIWSLCGFSPPLHHDHKKDDVYQQMWNLICTFPRKTLLITCYVNQWKKFIAYETVNKNKTK